MIDFAHVLLLFAGVAATYHLRHRAPRATAALGIALLFFAGLFFYRQWNASNGDAHWTDYEVAAGHILGRHIRDDFPHGGNLLALTLPPLRRASQDASHRRLQGLKEALGGRFRLTVAGPDRYHTGADDPAFVLWPAPDLPERIVAWCAEHPDTQAVISLLLSAPAFSADQLKALPPCYGFDARRDDHWAQLTRNGLLAGVVVRKSSSRPTVLPQNASADALFQQRFVFVEP